MVNKDATAHTITKDISETGYYAVNASGTSGSSACYLRATVDDTTISHEGYNVLIDLPVLMLYIQAGKCLS